MNEDRPKYFLIAIFQAGISPFEILSRIPHLDPGVFVFLMLATFAVLYVIFPKESLRIRRRLNMCLFVAFMELYQHFRICSN